MRQKVSPKDGVQGGTMGDPSIAEPRSPTVEQGAVAAAEDEEGSPRSPSPSSRFADTSQQIYLQWMRSGRPPAVPMSSVLTPSMATKAVTCVPEKVVAVEEKPGARRHFHQSEDQQETKREEVVEAASAKAVTMELAYVTERIIALWFPLVGNDKNGTKEATEEGQEKMLEEATSMLRVKHAGNCKVFDLSALNETSLYHEATMASHYLGWQGSNLAPPLERLCSSCKYIESWLSSDPQHIAVLFARGPCSKERIGVIISAYLTYSGICGSEEQALDRFAMRRFFQDKIGHLNSPSNVRYVGHFSGLLSGGIRMNAEPLFLKHVTIHGAPAFEVKSKGKLVCEGRNNGFGMDTTVPGEVCLKEQSVCFFLKIYQQGLSLVYTSPVYELSPTSEQLTIGVENSRTYPTSSPLHLRGDVLVKGYRLCRDWSCKRLHSNGHTLHRHSLFQCQFHTCAVAKSSLCFPRAELDEGEDTEDNVKYPPHNGSLELHFYSRKESSVSQSSPFPGPIRFPPGEGHCTLSSALYLPYADEDEEQAVANNIITHDSMEELCCKRNGSEEGNVESGENWANGVLDEEHEDRGSQRRPEGVGHLTGPLDGSLYATVSKGPQAERSMEEGFSARSPGVDARTPASPRPAFAPPSPLRSPHSESSRREALHSPPLHDHLDELLGDMLMTVENIPDLCPPPCEGPAGGGEEDIPYHARKDGRPFTYGAVPERKQKRAEEEEMHAELSSPGLVRRASRGQWQPEDASPTIDGYSNLTWLQLQQQKLRDRREGKTRQERCPQEFRLLKELRTYQRCSSSSGTQTLPAGGRWQRREDGYASDTSLPVGLGGHLPEYNGSTEGEDEWDGESRSWRGRDGAEKGRRGESRKMGENLTLPLRINTTTTEKNMWSEPGSPLLTRRSVSKEKASRYVGVAHTAKWKEDNTLRTIGSGVMMQPMSAEPHVEGERPFMAVKRAHEYAAATGRRSKDSIGSLDDGMAPVSQSRDDSFSSWATTSMTWGEEEDADEEMATEGDETDSRRGKPRPQTPAFPVHPRTPYSNGSATPVGYVEQSSFSEIHGKASLPPKSPPAIRKDRSHTTVSPDLQGTLGHRPLMSNGGSAVHKQITPNSSTLPRQAHGEHHEVSPAHVKFVRDTSRFWYKPTISREEAIAILKDKPPGTFIVRDSNSFPGAFGLALKVATPPSNVPSRISAGSNSNIDMSNELVRHFLIEPTSRGVKLKGCINEPVFSSLSALVYQHSLTAMALPCQLILPESEPTVVRAVSATDGTVNSNQILLQQGAACNVLYLVSVDTESLTGPQAVRRAVADLFSRLPMPAPTVVHFKVSGQGITLTDNKRRLFFRRHYPVNTISHCGLDPDDHRWTEKSEEFGNSISSNRCFGFVARKPSSKGDNQCHIFAELDPGQPATAIVNFVTRVMMAGTVGKTSNIV